MELDKGDIDEVHKNLGNDLTYLETHEQTSTGIKKVYIKKVRDWVRILVENDKIPIQLKDISSYVRTQLDNHNVTYTDGHFADIFEDDEKGNYFHSALGGIHTHEFEGGLCTCGDIEKNGIHYTQVKEEKKKDKKSTSEPENFLSEAHQELFENWKRQCSDLSSQSRDLLGKGEDSRTAEIIMQALPDPGEQLETAKSYTAHLISLGKKLDGRQKITDFMKLKAIILEEVEYTIAHVANLLGKFCVECNKCESVTPKHFTNNIKKLANPQTEKDNEHWKYLAWFKNIAFKCKCGQKNIININDWFSEQITRRTLEPPLKPIPINDPSINYGIAE